MSARAPAEPRRGGRAPLGTLGSVGADSAAGDAVRARLFAEMVFREDDPREPMDDIERRPRSGLRPTERAQWDEVHGCWVEWDRDDQLWVHVEQPTRPAAPGA